MTESDVKVLVDLFQFCEKNNKKKLKSRKIQTEKMEIDTDRTESDLGEFSN